VIPLRDSNPTREPPVVVWVLLAANVAVFLLELAIGLDTAVREFGLIPAELVRVFTGGGTDAVTRPLAGGEYFVQEPTGRWVWLSPITSMFMHGGWLHIISNMWFLWIFGDNVEDVLGKGRFIAFYLICGLGADLGQILVDPSSRVPMVGASGAISGILAGYMMLFPHARVLTLVPIFFFIQFVELPAFLFIFVWFGLQLLQGTISLGQVGTGQGGVAFFAHIGGFVVGLLLIKSMARGRVTKRPRRAQPGPWH
jgi:membrane associated rhomboid family serine protease